MHPLHDHVHTCNALAAGPSTRNGPHAKRPLNDLVDVVDPRLSENPHVSIDAKGRVFLRMFMQWYSFTVSEIITTGQTTGRGGQKLATIEILILGEDLDDDGTPNGQTFEHTIKSCPASQSGIIDINSWSAFVVCSCTYRNASGT